MKKMFLAATLAATMCVPAHAQYSNSGDGVYNAPDYDRVVNEAQVVEPTEKERNINKPLPINFTGDKAEYDSVIKVEAEYGMVKLEPDAKELLKIVDKHVMNEE